ncbi:unnamed protein product, partial [Symbiodinium sp. KB8]
MEDIVKEMVEELEKARLSRTLNEKEERFVAEYRQGKERAPDAAASKAENAPLKEERAMAAVEPESKGAPSLAEADMEPTSPAEETTPEFEEEEPSPAEGPRVAVKTEAPLAAEEGPVDQAAGEEEAKAEGRERAHGADTSSSEEKNAKKRKKQARRKAELLENQKL